MDLGWTPLLLGLALGAIPARALYAAGPRHLPLLDARTAGIRRSAESSARRRRRWWKLPLIWLDPPRGYVCAATIALGFDAIPLEGKGIGLVLHLVEALTLLGVISWQMESGRQETDQAMAPVGFLVGVLAGYSPWFSTVGCAVGLLGVTAMFAFHSFVWGYVIAGGLGFILGYFFMGLSPSLILFSAICGSPAIYAFFMRKPLVFPLRG